MNTFIRLLPMILVLMCASCATHHRAEAIFNASFEINVTNRTVSVHVMNLSGKTVFIEADRPADFLGRVPLTIIYFTRSDVVNFLKTQINEFVGKVHNKFLPTVPYEYSFWDVTPLEYPPSFSLVSYGKSLIPLDPKPVKGNIANPTAVFDFSFRLPEENEIVPDLIAAVDLHIPYFSGDLDLTHSYSSIRRQLKHETVRAERLIPFPTSRSSVSSFQDRHIESNDKFSVPPQNDNPVLPCF